MACVNFTGLESANDSEFRSTGGTWSIDSTIKRSGGYSLRTNPTGSNVGNARLAANRGDGRPNGEMSVSTLYTTFWFYVAQAPSSLEEKFIEMADTGGSTKAFFTLNSSRQIKAYNNAGSNAGTGSTALSLDTWYRIDIKTSTGSGNTAYEVLIDGVTELSGTMNTLTNSHGSVYLGKRDNLNSRDIDFYYDDIWCDDAAFPTEDYSIIRLAPTSNASPAQFTNGTGASDYTQVDEIPPSTGDYMMSPASPSSHYVNLSDTSAVGISGTILAFKAQMMARENTSGTSSNRLAIKSGSSTAYTDAYNHSTSNQHICLIRETDPDTSSAWTTSALDAVTIGIEEANSISVRCMFMSGYVAFAASAAEDYEAETAPSSSLGILNALTGSYVQDDTAGLSPAICSGSLDVLTASYLQLSEAETAPVQSTGTTNAVTANYSQVEAAVVAASSGTASIPPLTASYQAITSAIAGSIQAAASVQVLTASYQQENSASFTVVSGLAFLIPVSASAAAITEAETQAIPSSASISSITATYQALRNAEIQSAEVAASLQDATASYQATTFASVAGVAGSTTLPDVTAQAEGEAVAELPPITVTVYLASLTAVSVSEYSATIEVVSVAASLQTASALYSAVYSASVVAINGEGSTPTILATSEGARDADVTALSSSVSVLAVTATHQSEIVAALSEVIAGASASVVTANYVEEYTASLAALESLGDVTALSALASSDFASGSSPVEANALLSAISALYVQNEIAEIATLTIAGNLPSISGAQTYRAGLKKEDGFFILQENGSALIIQS